MARIAGVTTQKDLKGNTTHITINVKKHPAAIEALKSVGLIEKSELRKEYEANPEKFITLEEFRDRGHKRIEEIWKNWKK